MTKLPEVISTVERRRGWAVEDKLQILDAAFSKRGSVAAAADRFGVSRSLIYTWRAAVRNGRMPGVTMTGSGVSAFLPVTVVPEAAKPDTARSSAMPGTCRAASIEVRLANGRVLKASEGIAPALLSQLAAALDGSRT